MKLTDEDGVVIDDGTGDGTINDDDDSGFFSDRRLKDNIKIIDKPLEKINKINGVTFRWNDETKGKGDDIGVIAQDVMTIFPSVVHKNRDGYYKVEYYKLIGPMIEAIKTLKKENDELKLRLDKLENR